MPGSRGTDPKTLFKNRPTIVLRLPRSCVERAASVAKSTGEKLNVVVAKALCAELGVVYRPPVEKLPAEELSRRRRIRDRPRMLARYYAGKVPKPSRETRLRDREKRKLRHIAEFENAGRPFVPKGESLALYPVEWHKLPAEERRRNIKNFVHNEYEKDKKLKAKVDAANAWFDSNLSYKGQRKDGSDGRVRRRNTDAARHHDALVLWQKLQAERTHRMRVVTARTCPHSVWPSCASCAFYAKTRPCTCLFENGGANTQADLVCEKYRTFDHSVGYPDDWYDFVNGVEKSRSGPRRGSKREDEVLEKDETLDALRLEKSVERKVYRHSTKFIRERGGQARPRILPKKKPSFITREFWNRATKKPNEADLKLQGIRDSQLAQGIDTQKVDTDAIDRMNRIVSTFKIGGYLPGFSEGHLFDEPKEEPRCPDAQPG